ncbi:hypothetical protein [Pseudoneobacillus sp. C159]
MKLTQLELIKIIKNAKNLNENKYLAEHLLTRKDEKLIRNLLTWEISDYVRNNNPQNLNGKEIHVSHEHKKHDVSILYGKRKGGRGIKKDDIVYFPETIIELKFTKPSWIIDKENAPIELLSPQDNIWKENHREWKKRVGQEGGVIRDLNKMLEKQHKTLTETGETPVIHHIYVLPSPHEVIDNRYNGIIEGLLGFNEKLKDHAVIGKKAHHTIYKDLVRVYRKQLRRVESNNLLCRKTCFKLSSVAIQIGIGFGVKTDLIFLILSESNNR